MKIILVIDNHVKRRNTDPFSKMYQIFTDQEKALKHAVACGFEDDFGFGINLKPGRMNCYKCGDVDVSVIALEVQE